MEERRLVWLNIETGEFSNSWKESDYPSIDAQQLLKKYSPKSGWKLIEYKCLNDENFEFYNRMKVK